MRQCFELFEVYPVPVLGDHNGYYYSSPDGILQAHSVTNSLRFFLVRYLQIRPMDLMALVAFLHVSFMWYVNDRFLSQLTPRLRTLSVSSMTVLPKEGYSMLGVLVNRDVNSITSVFSALLPSMLCITSSIQLWRAVRDKACSCRINSYIYLSAICIKQKFKLWRAITS